MRLSVACEWHWSSNMILPLEPAAARAVYFTEVCDILLRVVSGWSAKQVSRNAFCIASLRIWQCHCHFCFLPTLERHGRCGNCVSGSNCTTCYAMEKTSENRR